MWGRFWPVLVVLAAAVATGCARAAMDECTDEGGGRSAACPVPVNAAFNVTVVATNTCGTPPEEYCVQTGDRGHQVLSPVRRRTAPPAASAAFLTDYNNQADTTWWQSQIMLPGCSTPTPSTSRCTCVTAPCALLAARLPGHLHSCSRLDRCPNSRMWALCSPACATQKFPSPTSLDLTPNFREPRCFPPASLCLLSSSNLAGFSFL